MPRTSRVPPLAAIAAALAALLAIGAAGGAFATDSRAAEERQALLANELNTIEIIDRFGDSVAWQHDWRERPELPVFALTNLALALGSLGRFGAADEVAEQVLARSPQDSDGWLWRCVQSTLSGRGAEAATIAATHESRAEPWQRALYALLAAYLQAARSGDSALAVPALQATIAPQVKTVGWSRLRDALSSRLVMQHTVWWLRPWRWWQLKS